MKNILLVLISFVIIGCRTWSPVTNTVDLTTVDFSNARNFKEAKACEIYLLGFIGPFGNAQVIQQFEHITLKRSMQLITIILMPLLLRKDVSLFMVKR